MKKLPCMLTVMLLWVGCALAQEKEVVQESNGQQKESKKLKISYVHLQGLKQLSLANKVPASDFAKLAPQSELLNNDFEDYAYDNIVSTNEVIEQAVLNITMGIRFYNKKENTYMANPVLRIGINAAHGTNLDGYYYKDEQVPFDTLTSGTTGQTIYIDSLTIHSYNMEYISNSFSIDGSLIFRTNQQKWVSVYTGIGITAGISFKTETDIFYGESVGTVLNFSNGESYRHMQNIFTDLTDDLEINTNLDKNFMSYFAYIPLGIELKAWGKSNFWKHVHLFYELKGGVSIVSLPELKTVTRVSLQNGFGLRYSFNQL